MLRRTLTSKSLIVFVLVLQFVPFILFPPESFSPTSQEWWLPVLLAILALIAVVELVVRGSAQIWPWYLMAFSQGFNIISRIMMFWPHATVVVNKANMPNWPYVILSLLSIALSAFMLWYIELPEVRMGLVRD